MAPRTSEIESGFRNIAVGANRLAKHGLPEGEFSQDKSRALGGLAVATCQVFRVVQLVYNHRDLIFM